MEFHYILIAIFVYIPLFIWWISWYDRQVSTFYRQVERDERGMPQARF